MRELRGSRLSLVTDWHPGPAYNDEACDNCGDCHDCCECHLEEGLMFNPNITKGPWTEDGDKIRDEHWNLVCWFFSHDDGYEEPEAGDLEAMIAIPELLKVYRRCRSIINRECRNIINKWGYDHAKIHFSEYLHARDAIKELEDRHGKELRNNG